jgi:hydrogenase-4 component F
MNWSVLVGVADKLNPQAMRLAFILALLGYGTKAGLAPMHTWKPDAYAEAPVPAAALLGAGFINCAIYAIMRFDVLTEKCLGHAFPGKLLAGFGVASILVAAPFVLGQRNFRRLLAYSSIDHAGIMVAGLGFGGRLGALGAALHMLFHAVTKPLMFFCAGDVQQHFGTPYFWKVRGVLRTLPWTGGLFLLATLAVTGTPPFSIFQSEFKILSAALAGGRGWLAFLFIAGVVTIFAGFLSHMSKMNLGTPHEAADPTTACPWKLGAMIALAVLIVVLGFWLPAPLFDLEHAMNSNVLTNLPALPLGGESRAILWRAVAGQRFWQAVCRRCPGLTYAGTGRALPGDKSPGGKAATSRRTPNAARIQTPLNHGLIPFPSAP